jgi:hypothetical protein
VFDLLRIIHSVGINGVGFDYRWSAYVVFLKFRHFRLLDLEVQHLI